LGYQAFPVLVALEGEADESLPSLTQFDHEIAAVRQGDGWTFVDLTADIVPFGEVPPAVTGEFGLLVKDDGSAVPVHFPTPGADQNRVRTLVVLGLDEKGHLEGTYRREATGLLQYQLRGMFPKMPEGKARTEVTEALASNLFESAHGDSLQISGGKDLGAPVWLSVHLAADGVLSKAAQGWLLKLPVPRFVNPQIASQLEREGERLFPFDVDAMAGSQMQEFELRLTLPVGWTADLPKAVQTEGPVGSYESRYTQDGRQVVIHRVLRGRTGVLPEDRKAELVTWLRTVAADDAQLLVLHPST
jgi:hypothetical protein